MFMIKKLGDCIKIDTPNTSLIFRLCGGYAEQLYYGGRIADAEDYEVFGPAVCGSAPAARMPYSAAGAGSESLAVIKNSDGSYVNRFTFRDFSIGAAGDAPGLPCSRGKAQSLILCLEDAFAKIALELRYSVFEDCDAIAASCRLTNNGSAPVSVLRLMSLQTELYGGFELTAFDGAWGRERYASARALTCGTVINDSKGGWSSFGHNPFVMLKRVGRVPGAFGFNLVYSGNHKEIFETRDGATRVLTGMNDYLFEYGLGAGESFFTPEAVMVYGPDAAAVTREMHKFVGQNIIAPHFRGAERPVLLNSWEAAYFNFNRKKLSALAGLARETGVELFVLDDGWYGKRNDDSSSLGDWLIENPKIEGGLADFIKELKASGMKFGLWLEPEMANPDSELYRAHPEFVMGNGREPVLWKNQLILDLTSAAVRKHLICAVSGVIDKYRPDYIKWDCNRDMTDMFGSTLKNQGEFFHRYILGLYEILETITKKYPHILFESCASGGNRYDLGMLYYMPQVWASDNTDAYDRLHIQEGTLYGYPQHTMGAHVSACPSHQTGNTTSLENRFNAAAAGLLGLELDLTKCAKAELETLKGQIAFYKKHRKLLQFGEYYRLDSAFEGNYCGWITVAADKSQAMATIAVKKRGMLRAADRFYLKGLDEAAVYTVTRRAQTNEEGRRVGFTASGGALMSLGVDFGDVFADTDRGQNSNSMGSRMFYLKRVK